MNSILKIDLSSLSPFKGGSSLPWTAISCILSIHWISLEPNWPSIETGSQVWEIFDSIGRPDYPLLKFGIDIENNAVIISLVLVTASEANFCVGPKCHSLRSFHQYDDRALAIYFLMKFYIAWAINWHKIDPFELYSFVDAVDLLHHKLGVCGRFQKRGIHFKGIALWIEFTLRCYFCLFLHILFIY